jgi:acyl dehydratase
MRDDDRMTDDQTTGDGPETTEDTLYFEDLEPGRSWDLGSTAFTREGILDFAEEFDPQSFHVDDEAAQRHFDGIIASGWHTSAACMELLATELLDEVAVVAALGIDELRWHGPVKPGDTLDVSVAVAATEQWDDTRGKVTFPLEATNQHGDTVHTREELVLVERRRPASSDSAGNET